MSHSDAKEWASAEALPKLPAELCDSVVDYLYEDKSALRACALVCKAWVPASTFHLFSSFSWPPCHHLWETRKLTEANDWECRCGTDQADFEQCLDDAVDQQLDEEPATAS